MKMMNIGRLTAWVLVVIMPLWLGSCKKENGGVIDPVTPNSIEGSWKIAGMKVNNGKDTQDILELLKSSGEADAVACLTDTKITFVSNGKITGAPSPSCKSAGAEEYNPATNNATWMVTGNKLTITDDGGPDTYDLNLNGNSMSWIIKQQDDTDSDGVKETYTTTIEFKRA